MEVQLGNNTVSVEIIRKNNKNIYFRFKEDGILYVTCNRFVREKEIVKMIKDNEKSFIRMYDRAMKRKKNNDRFHYLGEEYTVCFNEDVKKVLIDNNMIYVKDEKMFDKWYKNECIKVFNDRIEYLLDEFRDIPDFSLKIRKMTSRWGVNNTTKRIITLNSELLKKDISLIDYVIVHELCHFYEANHSSRFWYQVSLRYPNYKEARKRLRVE